MKTYNNIRRGDIFWITANPYRRTFGSVQQANRPAIIVSNDDGNTSALTYEIVYLTNSPKKQLPTHCPITSAEKPSIALCEQITTISSEQLGDFVGHCTAEEMAELDRCIIASLGLEQYTTMEADEDEAETELLLTMDESEEAEYLYDEIARLKEELAVAKRGEQLMKELYRELLEKTLK